MATKSSKYSAYHRNYNFVNYSPLLRIASHKSYQICQSGGNALISPSRAKCKSFGSFSGSIPILNAYSFISEN